MEDRAGLKGWQDFAGIRFFLQFVLFFFLVCTFSFSFFTHINKICKFEHSFLNKMIKFSLVSSSSVYTHIHACSHTYSCTCTSVHNTYQKLRHKADFLLESDYQLAYNYISNNWGIPWQVAYSISCTEQYLYWTCMVSQFTARVAHNFCQQHLQSNHGCVVPQNFTTASAGHK